MSTTITTLLSLAVLVTLGAAAWRLLSNRTSLPCPSWLAWMVELDNPLLRNNSAKAILSHLDLRPGMEVLDFGCGPGRLTIPAARAVGPAGKVTAFDIQEAMLGRVRTKAASGHIDNIHTIQGGAGEGKLGASRYDRALLVTVLGEVPDRRSLLDELFASLKPGGVLSITEVIADPHFQGRTGVRKLAAEAGFVETGFFGNRIDYTMTFRKP